MNNFLSNRIQSIEPSITISLSAKAKKYKELGRDIINVTTGELPFQATKNIRDALIKALTDGKDKYVDPSGIPELKEAIVKKLNYENNLVYSCEEIAIGNGVKELFFNIMASTLCKNDEVIIPAPYWVSFPEIVSFFEGQPIVVNTDQFDDFKITPEKLRSAITKKTKWLIINSPSNPTGSIYSYKELKDIADVLREPINQHVSIISDDIYEKIIFDNHDYNNIINVAPDLFGRTVILNGFSKSYCMTGWRLGYAAGRSEIINLVSKLKSHSNTCTPSFIQYAGIEALASNDSFIQENLIKIKKNRDIIVNGLNTIDGISCLNPKGSFFVFPSCKAFIGCKSQEGKEINSSLDFATYLLDEYNVAVIPGEAFGIKDHFRISYTIEEDSLKELLNRLNKACMNLLNI